MAQLRKRFWIELVLVVLASALLVLMLAETGWIEVVFGVDLDRGDGSLEWTTLIVMVVATITVLGAREAGMDLRAKRTGGSRARCEECGAVAPDDARAWRALRSDLVAEAELEEVEATDVDRLVFYCPECAAREFPDA